MSSVISQLSHPRIFHVPISRINSAVWGQSSTFLMILIFWTVFPELKLNWLTMFSHMYFVCLINEEILAFEVNLLFFGWLFWFLNVSTFFFWNWAINYWNWTYPYSVFTNFHVQFSNHYKTQHLKRHSQNLC